MQLITIGRETSIMTVTPLRIKFGQILRTYLQESNVRMTKLANILGVTPSAVSQMLAGKLVLNQTQLNRICEYLRLDQAQILQLNTILVNIRTGAQIVPSELNTLVFSLRCQRGLMQRQLSYLSGVSIAELNKLENDPNAVLTPATADKLAPILECSTEKLLQATTGDVSKVAHANSMPCVILRDFDEYDGHEPLVEFARRKAFKTVSPAHSLMLENPVVVQASGKDLSLGFPGIAQLIVLDKRPENVREEVKLCRDVSGNYFLFKPSGKKAFRLAGALRHPDAISWSVYVAGLNLNFLK